MANLNKTMLIGRLTRDPEAVADGKGAKFGFAVDNRRYNQTSGEWESVPVFLDCEVWNRGEQGQQATRVLDTLKKGQQLFIEGHLWMDQWQDKADGSNRTKIKVVVDNFQYLEPKDSGEQPQAAPARQAQRQPQGRGPQRPPAPAQNRRTPAPPARRPQQAAAAPPPDDDANDIPY